MARTIIFSSKRNEISTEDDFTKLLKIAVKDKKKYLKRGKTVKNKQELAERCRIAMNSFLLQEGYIEVDLFRCVIHVSNIIAKASNQVPESFYSVDYYIKGIKEGSLTSFCEGGDMCFLVCAFFPEYANRRCMTVRDYEHMGRQLYYKYYQDSKKLLGLCMGNNFKEMIFLAQETIKDI